MQFYDLHTSRPDFFSIGIESESGDYYLSIPVSSGPFDYEEYYRISKQLVDAYPDDIGELRKLANKCRRRENDENLMIEPGVNRGSSNPIAYP